jgi:hypothetical protein
MLKPKKNILILVAILVLGAVAFLVQTYVIPSIYPFIKGTNTPQGVNSEEVGKVLSYYKELTQSPLSKLTRNVIDLVKNSPQDKREKIISSFPFVGVSDVLTDKKLNSKFIMVRGESIERVGAKGFILFLDEPDTVFSVSYQETGSSTQPFSLVRFEKSEDTEEMITGFLKLVGPYLNDPGMTI